MSLKGFLRDVRGSSATRGWRRESVVTRISQCMTEAVTHSKNADAHDNQYVWNAV